jgi:hypothetical protein
VAASAWSKSGSSSSSSACSFSSAAQNPWMVEMRARGRSISTCDQKAPPSPAARTVTS